MPVVGEPMPKRKSAGMRFESDGVAVTIDDSGPRIPEDKLTKVCERFYRGRNKTAMVSSLGLAIADLASKRLGGSLSLKKPPRRGLSANLRL